MASAGKSQVCDKCCHLKIQCSLVPSGARRAAKRKVESEMEEVLSKCLKLVVEMTGMQAEPMMREILLEQLELLRDLHELFVRSSLRR